MKYLFNLSALADQFYKMAKIIHRPIVSLKFIKILDKKIQDDFGQIIKNIEFFLTDNAKDYFYDFFGMSDYQITFIKVRINYWNQDLWPLRHALKYGEDAIDYNLVNTIINNLKEIIDGVRKTKIEFQKDLDNKQERIDGELKYFNQEYYPNIDKNSYRKLFDIIHIFDNIVSNIEEAIPKFQSLNRPFNSPPEREDVEILYHTTINADKIFSQGFQKDWKGEGLGGSNSDKMGNPSVSFTSNLYVAKEIARCLKEGIMIARGQIDGEDILNWAIQDGIIENVEDLMKSIWGKVDNNDPKSVFNLYRSYLAYSRPGANFRYNPYFVNNIVDILKEKDQHNVGILAAEIDMTDPAIDYAPGMDEYRVPVRAIKKIVKILR